MDDKMQDRLDSLITPLAHDIRAAQFWNDVPKATTYQWGNDVMVNAFDIADTEVEAMKDIVSTLEMGLEIKSLFKPAVEEMLKTAKIVLTYAERDAVSEQPDDVAE